MSADKKKIVIYSAANAHGYFTCIVHRYLYNRDAYAVYVGDHATVGRAGGINLFDDSILYKQISGEWGNMNYLSPEEYESYLIKTFDDEFKAHKIDLSKVDEFFIGSNWSDFPVYLNLKDIKYNSFQEAVGDMGIPPKEFSIQFPGQYAARLKTGMFDWLDNKRIIKAYVHPKTVKGGHPKVVPFDIVKEMQNLPDEYKKLIAEQFNVPQDLSVTTSRILLLTQWFRRDGKLWESSETVKIYSLLIDLYFATCTKRLEVVIKPHPIDPMRDKYPAYFDNCTLLSSKFPSEFMGLIKNLKIDTAVTISSTAINTAESISEKQLTAKFFDQFYDIAPQFCFCARAVKLLALKCFYFGIFKEVMEPLAFQNKGFMPDSVTWHRIDEAPLTEEGAIIIYDNVWREGVTHTSLSKLYNSPYNSLSFIITDNIDNLIQTAEDAIYTEYLYKLTLCIKPYADNSVYSDTEKKDIYIFSKNSNLVNKLAAFELVMVLPYSKVVLIQKNIEQDNLSQKLKQNFILRNLNK